MLVHFNLVLSLEYFLFLKRVDVVRIGGGKGCAVVLWDDVTISIVNLSGLVCLLCGLALCLGF